MVLKDSELDELWGELGHYRGAIRKHLEMAISTEATMFSMASDRLFREYQNLKHDYEREHEAHGKLQRDYTLRVKALDERTRELIDAKKQMENLNRQVQELQQKLMHR